MLSQMLTSTAEIFDELLKSPRNQLSASEMGEVIYVGNGIARVAGLPTIGSEELLRFPDGIYGIAYNIDEDEIGVILLGESEHIAAGAKVYRTGRVVDIPVGEDLLGRTINAIGDPIDHKGPLKSKLRWPVEREAPAIMQRAPVVKLLKTGIKMVDALAPVGCGQRQLILGDRQTGKTAIAVDTIINQKDKNMICVYCAIGQRNTAVARLIEDLNQAGALSYCIFVVAAGYEPPGMQYIAPYAATSIAEYFMEKGKDVLVVYDDLTRHARAYREISLLMKRPPGREAYPGDIFYIHSRLLERATHMRPEFGGGSITAFPIIETQAQNIAAYIPTNLISISDGQLYLSPVLFQKGILPAVDIGKSVSRVGGKTQLAAYRSVAGHLRLFYSQFEELEAFSRFGTRMDEEVTRIIARGVRVREILKQPRFSPISAGEQIVALLAADQGVLDEIPLDAVQEAEKLICAAAREKHPGLLSRLQQGERMVHDDIKALLETFEETVRPLKEQL